MAERVWSEKDLAWRANRRLAVLRHAEEVGGNVAATCRYYGISRNIFYRWKRRYEDDGLEGLKDRSSAPHGHRQNEHDGVTLSTNHTLFVLIYNAALVFISNAGQQSGNRSTATTSKGIDIAKFSEWRQKST